MLYENAEHERVIADVVFSLLENRRSSETTYRTSYNFGTLTQQGLYLFVDNAPIKDRDSDNMIDTVTGYLMIAGNSVPAALYERFAPSVAYAGHLEVGEPIELFYESTYREDIGAYVHKLYAYFPEQNVIQAIFNEQTLLGFTSKNQLVLYYPRTSISSPQIGLVSINPVLHGITGNQILIMPADMPSEEIPDYADENFYFVTADMKVYHSTVSQPLPKMVYDFAGNFRAKGYTLTNWWYTRANNNHPGVCLCSQDQVQKYNTGAFYDFQLGQFIESSPECIGRPEVGTWYCS